MCQPPRAPRRRLKNKKNKKEGRAGRKCRNIPRCWLRRRVGTNPLTTAALFWAHIHLLIAFPCACRTPPISSDSYLRHSRRPSLPPLLIYPSSSLAFCPSPPSLLMPVDTLVDLRQRAGDLAHRLGYLSHFIPAARELLDIIHHLSSEILLRHNRKIVTLVEISRATLTRAGLKLYPFASCIPALRNYKAVYFDILRALQKRQDVIVDCDNLRDRVSRLLMPLSTWLVIHKEDSTSATPFSNPASLNRDVTTPPTPPEMFHLQHGKSSPIRRPPPAAHSTTAAPEELMPPPSSLPHRFQQPPSTTPRGWHLLQADHSNQTPGAIRMARTRIPRPPPPCEEPELEPEPDTRLGVTQAEPPPPPIITQRRSQRFGIFLTAANGGASGGRQRSLAVPRSSP